MLLQYSLKEYHYHNFLNPEQNRTPFINMIAHSNVIEFIRRTENQGWLLLNKTQKNAGGHPRIADFDPEDGTTLDESLEQLEYFLNHLVDGKYLIRSYKDDKQKRVGYIELDFFVNGKPVGNTSSFAGIGNAPQSSSYIGGASIGEIVAEKVQAALDKKELQELKAKVTELETQKEDPSGWKTQLSKIMGTLNDTAPHMIPVLAQEAMGIIKGIAGIFRPATLAGHPQTINYPIQNQEQNPNNNMTPEQTTEIENELEAHTEQYAQVIFRLRAVDPDLLTTLNKMADKAESNPSIINMLKSFL